MTGLLTACGRQQDVAVVLDMSGSNDDDFDAIIDFTRRLTLGLPVNPAYTRLAVVRYSDTANVSFYLDTYSTGEQVCNSIVNRGSVTSAVLVYGS